MLRSFHFTINELPLKGSISPVSRGERLLSNQSRLFFTEIVISPSQESRYTPVYMERSEAFAPEDARSNSFQIESVIFFAFSSAVFRAAAYSGTRSVPVIPR